MKEIVVKMEVCDECGKVSVPSNGVCLNCNIRWIYVTSSKSKLIFLLLVGSYAALAYCVYNLIIK